MGKALLFGQNWWLVPKLRTEYQVLPVLERKEHVWKPWLALMELLEPSVFFSIISKPDCLCYLLLLNMWAISSEKIVSSWMVRLYDFLLYLPVAKSNVINIIDPEVMLCVSSSLALIWRRLEDSGVFANLLKSWLFSFQCYAIYI